MATFDILDGIPLLQCGCAAVTAGAAITPLGASEAHAFLRRALAEDGVDVERFVRALRVTGAVVSGSAVCSALEQKPLSVLSDVDVYVMASRADALLAEFRGVFDKSHETLRYASFKPRQPGRDIYTPLYHSKERSYSNALQGITGIVRFLASKVVRDLPVEPPPGAAATWTSKPAAVYDTLFRVRPYDVIVLDDSAVPGVMEFLQRFDLTCTQNAWNGDRVVSFHPLCLRFREAYVTRVIDSDHLYRLLKYTRRGWTCIADPRLVQMPPCRGLNWGWDATEFWAVCCAVERGIAALRARSLKLRFANGNNPSVAGVPALAGMLHDG